MDDLSKWDMTDKFDYVEISSLIIGTDPVTVTDLNLLRPAINVVKSAYENAIAHYQFGLEIDGETDQPAIDSKSLFSISLLRLPPFKGEGGSYNKSIYGWVNVEEENAIHLQRFTRIEIARWLDENRIQSKYAFKKSGTKSKQLDEKINGKVITSLYKLVIGMAIDGYKYNPTDKKSSVTKEISDGLAIHGIEIDADTVRTHLKNSAEHVLTNIEKFKKSK
jgi:hypothetical protein